MYNRRHPISWAAAMVHVNSDASGAARPIAPEHADACLLGMQMTRPGVDQDGSKAAASGKAALVPKNES